MCWACRDEAQARVLMIIGLPQSMIIEVSRACRAIIAAGARLGRVLCRHRRGPPRGSPPGGANGPDSPRRAPPRGGAISRLGGALPGQRPCPRAAGYDSWPPRQLLAQLGFAHQIARLGIPAPIQAGRRWPVERTNSWMNGYGKLRRMTDRNAKIVDFYLYLAAALVVIRQIIQRARNPYR